MRKVNAAKNNITINLTPPKTMMKCALSTLAASASCAPKMMMSMMSMISGWKCDDQASDRSSECSWSRNGDLRDEKNSRRASSAPKSSADTGQPTIVDAVVGDPRFSILASALRAAGLVEALRADGPFTVFAPTDEAFANLPNGALNDLLKLENKDKLGAVLTYHVVNGNLQARDIESTTLKTLNGLKATVKVTAAETRIDNAKVIETDILAKNGVIHVINQVILPPVID